MGRALEYVELYGANNQKRAKMSLIFPTKFSENHSQLLIEITITSETSTSGSNR